jgi:hypothetical protein
MTTNRVFGILVLLALVLAVRAATFSASTERRYEPTVVIYLRQDNAQIAPVLGSAKLTATRIFAGIGVFLVWRNTARNPASGEAVVTFGMQLDTRVPESFHPGALAYAAPYATSGTRIHVLCDRVLKSSSREIQGPLLGHVMAHEIAHVLSGNDWHSVEGVMKARWDSHDYHQMISRPLPFDATAAEMIQATLEKWRARGSTDSPWLAADRE